MTRMIFICPSVILHMVLILEHTIIALQNPASFPIHCIMPIATNLKNAAL